MTPPQREFMDASSTLHDRQRALQLLFVASEIYPLAKTGGLADVCGSLPQELARLGVDVHLMLPGYPEALDRVSGVHGEVDLGEVLPGLHARLVQGRMPGSGLPVWLVDCPRLYRREGTLYQDPEGRDWDDNALRFALLNHVAARVAAGRTALDWKADIVHANDWHTGMVPLLLAAYGGDRPRSIFTIHNMAFQGLFPLDDARGLGLPEKVLGTDYAEFYGKLSFLKAGIASADMVTTVSPTYAREICTPEYGFGMEGLLQERSGHLLGILNGIDTRIWDPSTDEFLTRHYSSTNLAGKAACKADLQRHLGLQVDREAPLAVSLSRLTHQKMADVLLECLPAMLSRHPRLQVAVHGCGEHAMEEGLASLACAFPGRLSVRLGYQEELEHRMHAGADILLHGSRFEPCGLAQMYAMHYGTIPVVRHVGGLADSVIDAGEPPQRAIGSTGFAFDQPSGDAMLSALDRCLDMYHAWPKIWSGMRRLAMAGDFSWARSAREYVKLYVALAPRLDDPQVQDAKPATGRAPHMATALQGLKVVAGQRAITKVHPEDGRRAGRSSSGGRS